MFFISNKKNKEKKFMSLQIVSVFPALSVVLLGTVVLIKQE